MGYCPVCNSVLIGGECPFCGIEETNEEDYIKELYEEKWYDSLGEEEINGESIIGSTK